MFLPRALISLRASIAQAPVELEQAACSLGRSPVQALWAITIRLAAPGAAASMALVGLGITNELTATLMLAPNGTHTLATAFWSLTSELDYAAAAPYALIMVLFSLPLTSWLYVQSKRGCGPMSLLELPGHPQALRRGYGARRRRPQRSRPAAAPPSSDRPAPARRRSCASSPGSMPRMPGRSCSTDEILADGAKAVPAHRRGIGFVAQDGALFPHLSIADNIGFGLPRRDPGRDARIAELMRMVDLDPAMLRPPAGRTVRRAAAARGARPGARAPSRG